MPDDAFVETIDQLIEKFADYQRKNVVAARRKELGPKRTAALRKLRVAGAEL